MQILKSNIEELIKSRGLQKKFVAEKLGVSVHQLRNYEIGKSFIPIDKAFILAKLLNCLVDDLYENIIEEEPTKEEFLNEPIELLNLSVRVFHRLKKNDIYTYGDLLTKEITNTHGLGKVAKAEIDSKISELIKTLENDYK